MKLSYFIARRYLFSKKSFSIITIMSLICMLVVAMVTMAIVVVLSAFNGIERLIDDRYEYLDADIQVLPLTDKTFLLDSINCGLIAGMEGVVSCAPSIEERVFARYEDNQRIIILKGVTDGFIERSGLDSMMIDGEATLSLEGSAAAIMGVGVKYDLSLRLFEQVFHPLRLSAVERGKKLRNNLDQALNKKSIPVSGIFSINIDFDSDYVIVPVEFASDLLGYENEYTSLDIKLKEGADIEKIEADIEKLTGTEFEVRTRLEKNALVYKTNKTEKWATFMIMGFILLIATFNIIAALTLLINEKRHDIKVLTSMGATEATIKRIFFIEGALINSLGAFVGLILGLGFIFLQQRYGLISLEGGLIDYYPVEIQSSDLIAVFALVVGCGLISSIAPVQIFTRKYASS